MPRTLRARVLPPLFSITLALAFALSLLAPFPALAEKQASLQHAGRVNDFAGVLSPAAVGQLTAISSELDSKAQAQLIVVTIHSLDGVPIEDFSNQLFHRWGIGKKGQNRGVLILLAVSDHHYRVEVGYGLEPILPDGKVGGFGREIVPMLRQNNFTPAVVLLVSHIAGVIAADKGVTLASIAPPSPPPHPPTADNDTNSGSGLGMWIIIAIFFVIFAIVPWFRSRFGGGGGGYGGFSGSDSSGGSGGGSSDSGSSDSGGFDGGDSGGGGASGDW